MLIGSQIQAWRHSKGISLERLAQTAGLPASELEGIEAGDVDPAVSTVESLAAALKIPPSWLFGHPTAFDLLFRDPEGEGTDCHDHLDPVTERILSGSRMDRSLYVLLTALMQSAEPKLLRAAEMSLRSLVKQSRQATVPWQNRPSGHFEPPSD